MTTIQFDFVTLTDVIFSSEHNARKDLFVPKRSFKGSVALIGSSDQELRKLGNMSDRLGWQFGPIKRLSRSPLPPLLISPSKGRKWDLAAAEKSFSSNRNQQSAASLGNRSSARTTLLVFCCWMDSTDNRDIFLPLGRLRKRRVRVQQRQKSYYTRKEGRDVKVICCSCSALILSVGGRHRNTVWLCKVRKPCPIIIMLHSLLPYVTALAGLIHGPLKLRTVHLRDNTIIYESKVSVQNVFP
jgi:hypothetical protein